MPGQFHYQTVPAPQSPQKRNVFQWYKRQRKVAKIGIGCGTVLLTLMLCMCSLVAYAGVKVAPTDTTTVPTHVASIATSQPTHQTVTPTPVPTLKPTNTAVPTTVPTQVPTAVPTLAPVPTQAPAPTTAPTQPTGVNGNPWGYNFVPGNLIYNPPAAFCSYFACIASFVEPDDPGDGYVVECVDGKYSQSGNERGACSRHGGEAQPLYSH